MPDLDEAPCPPGKLSVPFGPALDATLRLLSTRPKLRRWGTWAGLAAMAGIVGAGAAPPPLGLLQPLWEVPAAREAVSRPLVVGLLVFLALFLAAMGAFARSFTFAFLEGIRDGTPRFSRFRPYLRAGTVHFAWSSAYSIPLYLLLFAGEWVVSRDAWHQVTRWITNPSPSATELDLLGMLLGAGAKFLIVLVPWTLLTLPAMAAMYELTPACMLLTGEGPAQAFRRIVAAGKKAPRTLAIYLGGRVALQLLGNVVALVVLIPCTLVAAIPGAPLVGGGWWLARALGGASTGGGAFVSTVTNLAAAVILYCILCGALLPVSLYLNTLAVKFVDALIARRE